MPNGQAIRQAGAGPAGGLGLKGVEMPEWDITIKETRMLKYRIEGGKEWAKARALEKAVSGEIPDDASVQHEVEDLVETS